MAEDKKERIKNKEKIRHRTEIIRNNLKAAGGGDSKTEVVPASMSDVKINFTTKNGQQTTLTLVGDEVRAEGEQSHKLQNAAEKGEKITDVSGGSGLSEAQLEALRAVEASDLPPEQKKQLREAVYSHNFSKDNSTPDEYNAKLSKEIKEKEDKKKKQKEDEQPNALDKILGHRGLVESKKDNKVINNATIKGLKMSQEVLNYATKKIAKSIP